MARAITGFRRFAVVAVTTAVASAWGRPPSSRDSVAGHTEKQGIRGRAGRVRNVATGKIEATLQADAQERRLAAARRRQLRRRLVNAQGKVLAVGPPFTLAHGETVATFVRLISRIPGASGFFPQCRRERRGDGGDARRDRATDGVQCASPDSGVADNAMMPTGWRQNQHIDPAAVTPQLPQPIRGTPQSWTGSPLCSGSSPGRHGLPCRADDRACSSLVLDRAPVFLAKSRILIRTNARPRRRT